MKTLNTISRIKRIEDAKKQRSDAINRYLMDCQTQVKQARQDMYFYTGIASFFALIFLSAILGLN